MIIDINNPECDVVKLLDEFVKNKFTYSNCAETSLEVTYKIPSEITFMGALGVVTEFNRIEPNKWKIIYTISSVITFIIKHSPPDDIKKIHSQALSLILAWKDLGLIEWDGKVETDEYHFLVK